MPRVYLPAALHWHIAALGSYLTDIDSAPLVQIQGYRCNFVLYLIKISVHAQSQHTPPKCHLPLQCKTYAILGAPFRTKVCIAQMVIIRFRKCGQSEDIFIERPQIQMFLGNDTPWHWNRCVMPVKISGTLHTFSMIVVRRVKPSAVHCHPSPFHIHRQGLQQAVAIKILIAVQVIVYIICRIWQSEPPTGIIAHHPGQIALTLPIILRPFTVGIDSIYIFVSQFVPFPLAPDL